MITSAKRDRTAARLRVKLATGLTGLAIAGAVVAACSTASAGTGAATPVAGQYRLPDSAAPAAKSAPGTYSTYPGDSRESLRFEYLPK